MTCELTDKCICGAAKDKTQLWVMLRAGRYLTPVLLTLVQASREERWFQSVGAVELNLGS